MHIDFHKYTSDFSETDIDGSGTVSRKNCLSVSILFVIHETMFLNDQSIITSSYIQWNTPSSNLGLHRLLLSVLFTLHLIVHAQVGLWAMSTDRLRKIGLPNPKDTTSSISYAEFG